MITLICDHCGESVTVESRTRCCWNGAVQNLISNNGMNCAYNEYADEALLLCTPCNDCMIAAKKNAKEIGEKRAREEFMRRFGKDDIENPKDK
jgi:hypothetical protein